MNLLNKIAIILVLVILTNYSKAQSLQDSIPVVISLTADDYANIMNVKTKINALTDVNYVGFCSNHKVFLLYVDPNFHGSATTFLSTLIKSTGILSLTLKEGTIKDIINFCEFNIPSEYNKNKLLNTH
jgi:hypothetical protein